MQYDGGEFDLSGHEVDRADPENRWSAEEVHRDGPGVQFNRGGININWKDFNISRSRGDRMINGAHSIIRLPNVDVGEGWLSQPLAEPGRSPE